MQLDKLQLDLRPRPNPQALDLGLALLRVNGTQAYLAFLALWLPLLAIALAIIYFRPTWGMWGPMLLWWLRPLLERAPLYVLSRNVFGERVHWKDAVKKWPKLLSGGWFRLLTWWRFFMPSRGIYQPIWVLEGLRGKQAAERRKVLGGDTAQAAYWFGVVFAHFEIVLQFGFVVFLGFFIADETSMNPFAEFFSLDREQEPLWISVFYVIAYAAAVAITAPIYTACCFTLYLNKRATLEAWDVELMLRQLHQAQGTHEQQTNASKHATSKHASSTLSGFLVIGLSIASLSLYSTNARAQEQNAERLEAQTNTATQTAPSCEPPEWYTDPRSERLPAKSEQQSQFRASLDAIYESDELRAFDCGETWRLKDRHNKEKKKKEAKKQESSNAYPLLALLIKYGLILALIALIAWFIYRYRGQFAALIYVQKRYKPTEIAGLDIRPESLPENVTEAVWRLWQEQQPRAALALLYRATLSRLVNERDVRIGKGATEKECLGFIDHARRKQRVTQHCQTLCHTITEAWIEGAYAHRWIDSTQLTAILEQWRIEFDAGAANEKLMPGKSESVKDDHGARTP